MRKVAHINFLDVVSTKDWGFPQRPFFWPPKVKELGFEPSSRKDCPEDVG